MKKLDKGFFVVIDGTDGSGKQTQTKLLKERLEKEGFQFYLLAFLGMGHLLQKWLKNI